MILDTINNSVRYYPLHQNFKRAFEFLKREDLARLAEGKYEINGDEIYASVSKGTGRKKDEANLEIHRNYIDIQFVISGCEEMGWTSTSKLKKQIEEYDAGKDIQFFGDEVESWVNVEAGEFVIFFPEDAHLPLISDEIIHKVVVKIKL